MDVQEFTHAHLHNNSNRIHSSLFSVCLDGLSWCFRPWGTIGSRLFWGITLGWPSLSMNAEWISQHGTRELYAVADTTDEKIKSGFQSLVDVAAVLYFWKDWSCSPWDQANFIAGWQLKKYKTANKLILKSFLYCILGSKCSQRKFC